MKRVSLVLAVLLIGALAGNAMATVNTYTDRATWQSNVSSSSTENFDALGGNTYQTLTLGQVTFDVPGSTSSDPLWVSTPGSYTPIGHALVGNYFTSTVRATFSGTTSAVGTDVANLSVSDTIAVTLVTAGGTTNYTAPFTYPNASFFGVTSDSPILSISFAPTNYWVGIDNFSYGSTGATVPEPSVMLLLGCGLLGLVGIKRNLKK